MSKEQKIGESSEKQAKDIVQSQPQHHSSQQASPQHPASEPSTKPKQPPNESQSSTSDTEPKKPAAVPGMPDQTSDKTSPTTPEDPRSRPRQVIAVSASKGPAAFFNLARKFLVTDETCDLSALEGAIVSAADAAHLLERSKLATIVRYVCVASFGVV
jgi:outer membrane biosynthesis protein TonB